MKQTYKVIGFDLDGTLVNSLPDLALSLNQTFAEAGLASAPESTVMTWIGKGVDVLFHQAMLWQREAQLSPDDLAHLKTRFDYFYAQNVCNSSYLYPNVSETLTDLKSLGYPLALVTNKPNKHVPAVLEALHIDTFFSEVLGGNSLPAIKPHPAPLFYLCGRLGCYPREVLFVGDSSNDIIAANSAGCVSVGLTYGYNYNQPIADSNPDYVLDDIAGLLALVTPAK